MGDPLSSPLNLLERWTPLLNNLFSTKMNGTPTPTFPQPSPQGCRFFDGCRRLSHVSHCCLLRRAAAYRILRFEKPRSSLNGFDSLSEAWIRKLFRFEQNYTGVHWVSAFHYRRKQAHRKYPWTSLFASLQSYQRSVHLSASISSLCQFSSLDEPPSESTASRPAQSGTAHLQNSREIDFF